MLTRPSMNWNSKGFVLCIVNPKKKVFWNIMKKSLPTWNNSLLRSNNSYPTKMTRSSIWTNLSLNWTNCWPRKKQSSRCNLNTMRKRDNRVRIGWALCCRSWQKVKQITLSYSRNTTTREQIGWVNSKNMSNCWENKKKRMKAISPCRSKKVDKLK